MGISDEITVVTILEIKATITFVISITFDSVSHSMMARKPTKMSAAHLEFLFCLSLLWLVCGCAELANNITTQINS